MPKSTPLEQVPVVAILVDVDVVVAVEDKWPALFLS